MGDGLLLSLSAGYVSDVITPANRATALSLNLAGISLAYTVGPIISGSLPVVPSVWISAGGACLSVVVMLLLVPESTSASARQKACSAHFIHLFTRACRLYTVYVGIHVHCFPPLQTKSCYPIPLSKLLQYFESLHSPCIYVQ